MMHDLLTLLMLVFLQAVLGFDNLLYISLESKRVAEASRQLVRRVGIGIAIVLRIVLLFIVIQAIESFQQPFFSVHIPGLIEGAFNIHATIVMVGGVFILYTAVKEISHMLSLADLSGHGEDAGPPRSVGTSIAVIVLMNLVFSFDSILSAIALTKVFWVMATAIVLSGVMMMVLADRVSDFLQRNRMYEVLGLFILLLVGVMLLSEGGHLAHLHLLGHPIEAMAKSTFYFVIGVLVIVDVAQGRYQKKLDRERSAEQTTP
jgi:predicted tellurium resistance membrane protein TerC